MVNVEGSLSADLIAQQNFGASRRGFDPEEVRAFLVKVAAEIVALHERQAALEDARREAEFRAAHPSFDEDTLLGAVGDETAHILKSAHEAAGDIKARAEENASRILKEAHQQADALRGEAETVLARRTEEAEGVAGRIKEAAKAEGERLVDQVRQQAKAIRAQAEAERNALIEGAQLTREKILSALTKKRNVAVAQVEALRAGRERLLESYQVVRQTLEEATYELSRAETEARAAADAVRHRPLTLDEGDGLEDDTEPTNPTMPIIQRRLMAALADPHAAPPPARAARPPVSSPASVASGSASRIEPPPGPRRPAAETGASPSEATPPAAAPPAPADPSGHVVAPPVAKADRPTGHAPTSTTAPSATEAGQIGHAPTFAAAPSATEAGQIGHAPTFAAAPSATEAGQIGHAPMSAAALSADAVRQTGHAAASPSAPARQAGQAATAPAASSTPGAALPGTAEVSQAGASGAPDPTLGAAQAPEASNKETPSAARATMAARPPIVRLTAAITIPPTPAAPKAEAEAAAAAAAAAAAGPTVGAPVQPDPVSAPATPSARHDDAPAPAAAPFPNPTETPAEVGTGKNVESLFARIRADRDRAVGRAREVLAEAPEEERAPTANADRPVPNEDEVLLQRRDGIVGPIEANLARRLKRALQDDQNDLLDRLRSLRSSQKAAAVLAERRTHAARFRDAGRPFLAEALGAGGSFAASVIPGLRVSEHLGSLDRLADELADAVVDPLRRRLENVLVAGDGDDPVVLAEAVGAAYREWKTKRVEVVAADHVAVAFAGGAFASMPSGVSLRWLVEDVDGPCPDCDDNVLAGSLRKGEPFPTGQRHPPAHPGCRCLLVPDPG